jgi:hypothetical protein
MRERAFRTTQTRRAQEVIRAQLWPYAHSPQQLVRQWPRDERHATSAVVPTAHGDPMPLGDSLHLLILEAAPVLQLDLAVGKAACIRSVASPLSPPEVAEPVIGLRRARPRLRARPWLPSALRLCVNTRSWCNNAITCCDRMISVLGLRQQQAVIRSWLMH